MDSGEVRQPSDLSYYEWQINWLLSDAPRSPSEAAVRAQEIARQTGKSAAEAALDVAEDIRDLSSESRRHEKRIP